MKLFMVFVIFFLNQSKNVYLRANIASRKYSEMHRLELAEAPGLACRLIEVKKKKSLLENTNWV